MPPQASHSLRVVVFSDAEAGRNGVGTYYQDLAAHLSGRVESFTVVAPQRRPRAGHEWLSLPLPGDATQRLFFPRTRSLARVIQQQEPHAVVIPTVGPYAAIGTWLARRHGIPVCVAHHTNFDRLVEHYWNVVLAIPSRWALSAAASWLIRRSDSVLTMNVESLEDARMRGAKRVRMAGTPLAAPFLLKPRRPLSATASRVLFLGRLAAEKGVQHVLDAAARRPEFQVSIAGDGPLRRQVLAAAERLPNLHYLGWLGREQVLTAIDDTDVLVLPSVIETFGTVALEALARQRLVLVSHDCGITQWPSLAEGLFTVRRDEHLADSLNRLARLPVAERQAIVTRGRRAVAQFNDQTIDGWIDILMEVSGRSPSHRTPAARETVTV